MKYLLLALSIWPLMYNTASAQATEQQLLEYTSRAGQMIFNYHASFDVAYHAVLQRENADYTPEVYAGGPYDDGWAFSFGSMNEESEFILDYGVIVGGDRSIISFEAFDFHRPASFYHNLAANALVVVRENFEQLRMESDHLTASHYRIAVLPFPRGHVTAFVSPFDTCEGITFFGNDLTYVLERETLSVTGHNRYHQRLLQLPDKLPEDAVIAMLDVPQAPYPSPLDVSQTMRRGEPLVVRSANGFFKISPQGSIGRIPDDDPIVQSFGND